jgi:hypothetical protein
MACRSPKDVYGRCFFCLASASFALVIILKCENIDLFL